jgi:hypothetical protein
MSQKGFTLIEPIGTLVAPSSNSMLRVARASSLAEKLQWASRFACSDNLKRYRGSGNGCGRGRGWRAREPVQHAGCRDGRQRLVIDGSHARATVLGNAIGAASNLSIKPATRSYQHDG